MSLLARLENVFESLLEGSFRRAFSARLEPLEIARALERAMLAERSVGTDAVTVPNRYLALVNPVEFERLAARRSSIETDAAIHLERRASEQDMRPIGPIQVEIAADPRVARSSVRTEARFEEDATLVDGAVEHTRRIDVVRPAPRSNSPALVVVDEDGEATRLDGTPLRIGRGPDNDLVVPDVRVSRYHAVIEPASGGWVLRDLQSTNGTFLDGEKVDEAHLDGPAEISLGGYQMALRPG
jgi:hypothetical protein